MNTKTIRIDETIYKVQFDFAANRILTEKWKLKTLGEIGIVLSKVFKFKKGQEPTIKQFTALGDFILAGILSAQPDAQINSDDVVQALLDDPDKIGEIISLYVDSIPKAKNAAKPKKVNRVKVS